VKLKTTDRVQMKVSGSDKIQPRISPHLRNETDERENAMDSDEPGGFENVTRYNSKTALQAISATSSCQPKRAWMETEKEVSTTNVLSAVAKETEDRNSESKNPPGLRKGSSFKALHFQVESRIAHASMIKDEIKSKKRKAVKSLDEAMELTMPYFLGGFSRRSPVRMKCFQMLRSFRWKAFFIIVNLANCIYIASVPEMYRESFNAEGKLPSNTSNHGGHRLLPSSISPDALVNSPLHSHLRSLPQSYQNATSNYAAAFEFLCVGAIVLELLVGCIAIGAVSDETAYLRCSNFHKLDFALLLVTALEYTLSFTLGVTYFSFRAFRLLRLLKPLLRMEVFRDVKEVLAAPTRLRLTAHVAAVHSRPPLWTLGPSSIYTYIYI
jgi:hypothetical protein